MSFEPDFDEDEDEAGVDREDFSYFLSEDENHMAFAMSVLHRAYEMIGRGEDPGAVAQAVDLLFHETGEVPAVYDVFGWASDYFENIDPEEFERRYVGSPALGLLTDEDTDQIADALEGALEQVNLENA